MPEQLDAVIVKELHARRARGAPRGHDEVLRAARRAAHDHDLRGDRVADDRPSIPNRSRHGLEVAAAVLIFVIAAAAVYRRAGGPSSEVVMPGIAAPASAPAVTSTMPPLPAEGCPVAADCSLPAQPTAIDVPGVPPGWTRDPENRMFPDSPRVLHRDFTAPQGDIGGPGGAVPQRIHLVVYIDPAVASGARVQWATKPAVPLGHGRTLHVLSPQALPAAVPDPSLTITSIGADLGGDVSVQATGEGVALDVLQRAVASIVVR